MSNTDLFDGLEEPVEEDDFLTLVHHPRFRNLQRNSPNSWTVYVVLDETANSIGQGSGSTPSSAMYAALQQIERS